MGCFDYTCECGGETCAHVGGQLDESQVIIEVPLSDGTVVYLKGHYQEYGYVQVNEEDFYLTEFEEYFDCWYDDSHDGFLLANKVWTVSEYTTVQDEFGDEVRGDVQRKCFDTQGKLVTSLTPNIYDMCMRWRP